MPRLRITIPRQSRDGSFTPLYSFSADRSASAPASGGLLQATDGAVYGTTAWDGDYGRGAVFRWTRDGTLTILHSFAGGGEGVPIALLQATDGNFYGATYAGGGPGDIPPRRGAIYSLVWMSFQKTDGQYTSSAPYPERLLSTAGDIGPPHISPDRSFTWDFLPRVRPITVGPGEEYTLQFPVSGALEQPGSLPSGQYEVRFSTTLELFVGALNGQWAELCTLRIQVDSSATGFVR
jgi:uncharacterized repeat protein (TIGR03803 family)